MRRWAVVLPDSRNLAPALAVGKVLERTDVTLLSTGIIVHFINACEHTCTHMCTCPTAFMWKSEDNFMEVGSLLLITWVPGI